MSVRQYEPASEAELFEALSPFRAAFTRARVESMLGAAPQRPSHLRPEGASTVAEPGRAVIRFEVRIERRRGKRSADVRRWNKLGAEGWELVAAMGGEVFFRRARMQDVGRGQVI